MSRRARHSTARSQGADCGVRSIDHGLAPLQRNEQAPSLYSWGRSATGDACGGERRRPADLPIRAQLLGLDRARTEAALEWWQGQARQYQPKKGPVSTPRVLGTATPAR